MSLEAIQFDRSHRDDISVRVLDQLLLPYTTKYVPIYTIDDGYTVINTMQVRGAPAIAIVGALAVLMEIQLLQNDGFARTQTFYDISSFELTRSALSQRLDFLLSSRPTAVNLSNALREIRVLLAQSAGLAAFGNGVYDFVCRLIDEDLTNNVKMGDNGAAFLLDALQQEGFDEDFAVLTICNTGSLATSGYGTALGVVRSLWNDSLAKSQAPGDGSAKKRKLNQGRAKMVQVYPLETRPYNQGARLTAYELVHDQIPATLIPDSSIAYRIATSPVPIKAAFVGADRIVRNGDTANKIGTYQLALVCKHFGIKFFVTAPKTTIDSKTETGAGIVVEERKPNEFKHVSGTLIDSQTGLPCVDNQDKPVSASVGVAPSEIDVWNPAFDITPHELIDGIVTEDGVFTKSASGSFDLTNLFA
ncbi:S-methyl-5-thioribose-1-phosphate isomerase MRI1 [Lachancea thermotolerans CBS 6340]|uniref:Methylthioribose-1-phosphate isomerase n=1 Tax=Lachancea thermotolerans (strain ATCC 56472 / CBS 6340 / NRRL Y-8284) TaxID=559295 RepID=MTNA_LACTC|nr:KLTH0E05236p [Lachancea thermotolerans CBS 6340]C5DHL1.1 RecName: Full=Methylthioribose-1-phosphate isomerase; Short=M1Pi; Short=MTR-1-P isomerase; AltName: Full=S-methyl-5-thioribose-1-phosphate isomerase; AltName: Full=Translation initiation factor eIF-2B subunit alpha/beta/delta-like protein [Lachancea thermotolerans CBS 6340]CAR23272.1 KLTH0E05236p [Lachancea thermotolerans CBS 6340]